ncbi:50S ribosomal protein L3 [Candidatus Kaiserbacteria bacterium]|nr:50S ribosomal protein L3 [Candidatus Kaiserbacteria bacterium]
MTKFMLGTKGRMTQVFDDAGVVTPGTIVTAGPLTVTQVKTKEKDGYASAQVGFGVRKEKNTNAALKGHMSAAVGSASGGKDIVYPRHMREFAPDAEMNRGDTIDVSIFAVGDVVAVSAVSKGKGFQGVVKRHGFHGGPRSHGQKNKERSPGSIAGAGRAGGRVSLGMRMAGRMGNDRVTVRNLRIVQIDKDTNTLVISGAIPGKPGTLVEIRG